MDLVINVVLLERIGVLLTDKLNSNRQLDLIDLPIMESPIDTVKRALEWAEQNNEDAILFATQRFQPDEYDLSALFDCVLKLANEEIYTIGLKNNTLKKGSTVNHNLSLVDKWTEIDGWIMLRPHFNLLKQLDIAAIEEYFDRKATLYDILNISSPSKFIWHVKRKKILPERRINVIIPFRNVEKYIPECITSIQNQLYLNYRIFFIDDCSEDNSLALIPKAPTYNITKNNKRKYALLNIMEILLNEKFESKDIICIVDGDDKLAHPYVFRVLNHCYSTTDTLITYGSYRTINGLVTVGEKYTAKEFKQLRKSTWKASHLKTFQFSLFKDYHNYDMHLEHLKDSKGNFLKMPYDMAIMFPLLELAGFDRSNYIPMPIYLYRIHENNDHVTNTKDQMNGALEIRNKKPIKI